MSAQQTADLLNELILKSQEILENHPFNVARKERGERMANIIWPWGGGYRPHMLTLSRCILRSSEVPLSLQSI